jgi:hypothetical protein
MMDLHLLQFKYGQKGSQVKDMHRPLPQNHKDPNEDYLARVGL